MKKLVLFIYSVMLTTLAYAADYVHILADCTNAEYSDGYGYRGNTTTSTNIVSFAKKLCAGTYNNCEVSATGEYWQKQSSCPCSSCSKCGVFDVYLPDWDETHKMILCTKVETQGGFCNLLTDGCASGYRGTKPEIVLSNYEVGTDAEFTNKAQWDCCNNGECTGYGYRVIDNYASSGLAQRGANTCNTSGSCSPSYSNWICNIGYYCNRTGCTPSTTTNPNNLSTMCVKCSTTTGNDAATSYYPTTGGPKNCYLPANTPFGDEIGTFIYTSNCGYQT